MIQAIVKLQGCTTKPGRKAFVSGGRKEHGIAKGPIRFYEVTGKNWAAIKRAVADWDTTGAKTMGWTEVNSKSVCAFREVPSVLGMQPTETRMRLMAMTTTVGNQQVFMTEGQ